MELSDQRTCQSEKLFAIQSRQAVEQKLKRSTLCNIPLSGGVLAASYNTYYFYNMFKAASTKANKWPMPESLLFLGAISLSLFSTHIFFYHYGQKRVLNQEKRFWDDKIIKLNDQTDALAESRSATLEDCFF